MNLFSLLPSRSPRLSPSLSFSFSLDFLSIFHASRYLAVGCSLLTKLGHNARLVDALIAFDTDGGETRLGGGSGVGGGPRRSSGGGGGGGFGSGVGGGERGLHSPQVASLATESPQQRGGRGGGETKAGDDSHRGGHRGSGGGAGVSGASGVPGAGGGIQKKAPLVYSAERQAVGPLFGFDLAPGGDKEAGLAPRMKEFILRCKVPRLFFNNSATSASSASFSVDDRGTSSVYLS